MALRKMDTYVIFSTCLYHFHNTAEQTNVHNTAEYITVNNGAEYETIHHIVE